jgi:hypothetical protein
LRERDRKTMATDDQKPGTVGGSPVNENTELPSTEGQVLHDETYHPAKRATTPLFNVGDDVWIYVFIKGSQGYVNFTISARRKEMGYYEYQIMDPKNGELYQKGEWITEERLRLYEKVRDR